MTRIVVLGGGPGGYEAALVGAQLGAEVTIVERAGVGGACVLADCVPSKTLIATSESMVSLAASPSLGVRFDGGADLDAGRVTVELARVNARVRSLAKAQSADIASRLTGEGVRIVTGSGRLDGPGRVVVDDEVLPADVVLLATGATPRVLPGLVPDGKRILSWQQVYDLDEIPERLVVVGSGVTGAEFANAFQALGSAVTLVSSRDRVLPGEDADAAAVLEEVFLRRGMTVLSRSRAVEVTASASGVTVTLQDGRVVEGTHCLLAVGSEPCTQGLGLEEAGVRLRDTGAIAVDRVSRTTAAGVYAAGDCTGVLLLASVAAMQGRIAMWHALGEAVAPLRLTDVAATVFTDPEIATVGVTQEVVDSGSVQAVGRMLPLRTNARAKMQAVEHGFVKLFCRPGVGTILGGVVVSPRASELILAVSLAVHNGSTVDQFAQSFAIYPSLSGSLTEAARQLHQEYS